MRGLRTRSKACDRKNQKTKKKRTFDSTPMTVSHVDPSLTNHVISVWRSHYVIKQLQGVWPQKQKKQYGSSGSSGLSLACDFLLPATEKITRWPSRR